MSSENSTEEINDRRSDELEALSAYYGRDLSSTLALTSDDNDAPLDGPWFLRIRHDERGENNSSLGVPTLEIRLPPSYPIGDTPPKPILHNIMMNPTKKEELLQELIDMYEGFEVAILWTERCREELLSFEIETSNVNNVECQVDDTTTDNIDNEVRSRTYIPSTSKFDQPIRNFPVGVLDNAAFKREIIRTPPFHPPKSGPSELMIAHVSSVDCIEHVQWVLGELLFNDKKVSRASHNMFAYRFTKDGILVSDNDDDGEKGSGAKIASLLQLSKVENVLVVVSRWYGGIHLGPARFKHIASVARDGLVLAGFITD
ncbi:hypothetical protein ACHAWO_007274 [Cyclotella atomus]|uniref:RWD domain-containing protein n=1 Tax=Cyclotella atomus TaxID=382360 RepID=A0ABD3MZF7_9STRA